MRIRREIARLGVCLGVPFGCVLLISTSITTNVGAAGEKNGSAQQHSFVTPAQAGTSNSGGSGGSQGHQQPPTTAQDPGPRVGATAPATGSPLSTLTPQEFQFFQDGLARFAEIDSVKGGAPGEPGTGLGPTYNLNSCGGCHAQPAVGGSSPSLNPQFAAAADYGATNSMPPFLTIDGPVLEARFPYQMNSNGTVSTVPDGGVHDLFTIAGRNDAPGCSMTQPPFAQMMQVKNIIFRIPTPVFGAGLIENIPDATIYANMSSNVGLKQKLGITGHPNLSGNDGTITRFGWKAQNKSLQIFSGEAYNVEMGVTNELFPEERSTPSGSCKPNPTPEDTTNFPASGAAINSDVVGFSIFMRFLAPPAPSTQGIPGNPSPRSISNGQALFSQIHCDMCHTPAMQTASSTFAPALSNRSAALFSDLLVHHMGTGLTDSISQGAAGPDEFRTAPLWGLGQRLFFLHDGRATPSNGGLLTAIQDHASSGSEANGVINLFTQLSDQQKQDLLNFLRSL
jgi:CxxC motif-containing protein (DUF1111 family)